MSGTPPFTAAEMIKYLDRFVIGQDSAKETITSAAILHIFRRLYNIHVNNDIVFKKSNVLLTGPSGSGKTLLVRSLSKAVRHFLGLADLCPVLEIDCTRLSATGWVGDDIYKVIEEHYAFCRREKLDFASSIVFLDEVDKICMAAVGQGGTDHNRNTQYSLLKAVEGITLPGNVSTDSMMFVFAGNFPQLRHKREADAKTPMGFASTVEEESKKSLQQELEDAGLITQLAGRISLMDELSLLGKEEIRQAFVNAEDGLLDQYKRLWRFMTDGETLKLTKKEIDSIVDYCYENNVGVRGLQAKLDDVLKAKLLKL